MQNATIKGSVIQFTFCIPVEDPYVLVQVPTLCITWELNLFQWVAHTLIHVLVSASRTHISHLQWDTDTCIVTMTLKHPHTGCNLHHNTISWCIYHHMHGGHKLQK
jgi:hypothetical protein